MTRKQDFRCVPKCASQYFIGSYKIMCKWLLPQQNPCRACLSQGQPLPWKVYHRSEERHKLQEGEIEAWS
jgi:hypothetical protein